MKFKVNNECTFEALDDLIPFQSTFYSVSWKYVHYSGYKSYCYNGTQDFIVVFRASSL
jgi:hypothetical protein